MSNGYKVFWTEEALSNLTQIVEYLLKEWSEKEVKQFARAIDKIIALIQIRPEIFPGIHGKMEVRRAVLKRQITIYYQVRKRDKVVVILTIWDNRQSQIKLKV